MRGTILLLALLALPGAMAGEQTMSGNLDLATGQEGIWRFYPAAAPEAGLRRVLLIGDSIVEGYRGVVIRELKGKANVDVWLTPAHENHPDLLSDLQKVLTQGPYAVVHFNIGLHGWPKGRIPEGHYEPIMRQYVATLRRYAGAAQLIWASTTPLTVQGKPTELDPTDNPTITNRNAIAAQIMTDAGIAINDLYGLVTDRLHLAIGDRAHWTGPGYELMGMQAAKRIAEALAPAEFYVATHGRDVWSGKLATPTAAETDGPFRTLERARDEVRRLRNSGVLAGKGVTIAIRGGVYTLDRSFSLEAQDSGKPGLPVVYQACAGERVVLTGGRRVPSDAFQAVTDVTVLERLVAEARGHVVQASLRALGIADPGSYPVKFQGAPEVPELFFNDERLTPARWPNEGWATIATIVEPGPAATAGDHGDQGGVFEYSGDRPSRWNVEAGIWLHGYWCYDWNSEVIRVKAIDRSKRQITLAAPARYAIKKGNPSPRRYYALNLLEELDRPGEYYIDGKTGLLYLWPPAPLANARVVLSLLKAPMVSVKDATDVTLRGLTIEASLDSGITVSGGSGVRIQACEVRNTRELGMHISGGSGHKVEACDVHDTGTGGIVLSGGDRRTLTPAGHEAINNHIWRFSRHQLTYANALLIQGVGNAARHNLLHDAPHQAVGIAGNDHVFEYNVVHHVCMETDDCGAWYKGRNPSCRGNVVRYNFWYAIGSPMGHGNAAIYFDDGDGGETVFGNVFFRCGEPGKGAFGTVFSHGGHDNLAENNVFIECKRALGSVPWNDSRWQATIRGGSSFSWPDKLLKEVDITQPPYTTHYPALIGFMDPKSGQPRSNRGVRNVLVRCGNVGSGNWEVPVDENWSTAQDPGFVDAAAGDFRLKPDAEVFSKLPGFQPIPFEQMGLFKDTLRPSVPATVWPCNEEKP